ncbi:TetR/AcrR family transcriptional regulator [Sphingomonas sp. S1-29]|uniref:TetR/AcrR family transcriptional regulator n=1 Tax=Sphingomonas sp. S1-29 TaxID=2991074 RepID=UPI00223FAECE|nr:TetR/AcrR family transcriptional regulator [Sphingomonas sp. S1-29]UZK68600.1 TetR/AcrR family transcriptional regulator [Sphingomonas sp. S1-29]
MTAYSGIGRRRLAASEESSAGYKAKREEIGQAAIRVFHRLGYDRASMTAVADEMGVDRASLYYYVSSKEALFDDVVRAAVERNYEIAQQIEQSALAPRAKLRDLVMLLMASYGEHYPLFYIFIRENMSDVGHQRAQWAKDMGRVNRKTTDMVIAIIEEGYADGSFRNVGPSDIVAYGVLGVLGWTHRWYRPDQSAASAEQIGRTYAEMIVTGLETPAH